MRAWLFKLTWSLVRPVAMLVDQSKVRDPAAGGAGGSGIACTIVLGGPSVAGTVAEKAATVGGVLERAESGVPLMAEDGRFATSPERIRVAMTDGSFDNFAAYHEMGHCADPDFRVEAVRDADGHGRAYRAHLHEAFADAFATIMIARAEGHTRTAEEMAHLRMLSTATGGSFHALAETRGGDRAAEVIDNPGARYHTAPTIDATVAWIREVGIEWVRAMSPEAIVAKARELVEAVRLSPEAHARLKVDLLGTRMDGGRMLFGPGLGQGFAARAAEAMAALGFRPRAGDAPGPAGPETVLTADSGGAPWGRAPWGGLSAPAGGGAFVNRADVGATDVDAELDADIREGAWIVATARRGKVVEVRMREADGTVTRAIVAGKGEVMRYGPDGKLSSLSPDRPAITLAEGTVRHRLVVDGEQIDVDADRIRRHFEERRQAAPGGRP